ncbi:MAG TPA: DUF5610 domain-containing protein [Marinospirillum sp.]|uniref:DUF5610 domain-containing protein n=1 Tax=Marinospirillum sp. TaxID=2183934 RepID=UPI002B48200B|nr:DUF5610 domain-containing protein [Marinospirillum sp.]HKM15415.1 DUF5610 domain-containing protein [Marinospirillum sp.]
MSTQNISLSNASSNLAPKTSNNKNSAIGDTKPAEVEAKPTDVKTKFTEEEKVEFTKQAEATALANKKSLLDTMFGKNTKADSNAMRILAQETTIAIEDILKKELGDDSFSLQKLVDKTSGIKGQEDYWSSEKTSDRIITGATSYFETFKEKNASLSNEEVVDKYMNLITPALKKGMGEAVDILKGFNAFEGGVKETVETTQKLVFEKLEAFREKMLNIDKPQAEDKPLFEDTSAKPEVAGE